MQNSFYQIELEDNLYEVKINLTDLLIDQYELELTLGYDNNFPEYFNEIVDEILNQLSSYCEIKAGYKICNIEITADKNINLQINNVLLNPDKIVISQFKKAEKAAVFTATIGNKLENWAQHLLNTGDPAKGFLADTIASLLIENTADLLHNHIKKEMAQKGLNITNRYSPGYCDWNVAEQHLLFSLLPKNFCGITLTKSALMLPIKSVSGIIGIGKDVKYDEYFCEKCGLKDCTHKSIRKNKIN